MTFSPCAKKKPKRFPSLSIQTRAFTLVEVLVVISILAVLAALAFPVLSSANHKADSAKCASNLRQIHAAASLFSTDNGMEFAPLHFFFRLDQEGYLERTSEAWVCPGDDRTNKSSGLGGSHQLSYAINAGRTGYAPANFSQAKERLMRIQDPANTVYFGDAEQYWMDSHPANQNLSFRHKGRANVIFVDGHVESIPADDLTIYERF